jgi:hypothetical protein
MVTAGKADSARRESFLSAGLYHGSRPFVSVDSWVFRNLGGLDAGGSNSGSQGVGTPAWERAVCRVAAHSATGHTEPDGVFGELAVELAERYGG